MAHFSVRKWFGFEAKGSRRTRRRLGAIPRVEPLESRDVPTTTINTIASWNGSYDLSPFGVPDTSTYGQTVTVPATDSVLQTFTFEMRQPTTLTFRGEVYAWNGFRASGPDLFQSGPRTTTQSNNFEAVTFTIPGGLSLTPGAKYVLFATRDVDSSPNGTGAWGLNQSSDAYSGGGFVFLNDTGNSSLWTTTNWSSFGQDMAFQATFTTPPTTTSASPASATEGGGSFTLTVNGTNFVNPSTVQWNGTSLTTTFLSSTQLQAVVPAADLAEDGSASISVVNANGTSNAQTFAIVDAALHATATAVSATEGQPVNNVQVATFNDTDPGGQVGDYAAAISWGDGDTSTGSISASGSGFVVTGSKPHSYAEEGPFTVSVSITDTDGQANANTWSTLTAMPSSAYGLGVAAGTDGRIYSMGGYNGSYSNSVYAYTPSSNSWAALAPMPTASYLFGSATGSDGRIYVIGGDTSSGYTNAVYAYTPSSNTWAALAPLPTGSTGRFGLAAAAGADGRIYAIGGYDASLGYTNTVYAYTPSSNTWAALAPLPIGSAGRYLLAAAAGADGRIYAMGGNHASLGSTNTVYAYTPSSNMWTQVASMPTGSAGRYGLAAATGADGRMYAIGGYDPSLGYTNTVYAYSPSSNTWAQAASMATARGYLGAAAGTDGRIYAIGGHDNNGYSNAAEALPPRIVATATSTATVADSPLSNVANVAFSAGEGTPFSGTVASFTDTDPGTTGDPTTNPADYSATITWGDGSTSPGTIAYAGMPDNFTVNAGGTPHTYAEEGTQASNFFVTIRHGSLAAVSTPAIPVTVSDPVVVVTGGNGFSAVEGALSASQVLATFTDAGGPEPTGNYSATINWGDGTATSGADRITYNSTSQTFSVYGSHQYAQESATDHSGSNPYQITVTVTHENANSLGVTGDLSLWLRADAGVTTNGSGSVSAWTDQSGQGHNASQASGGQQAQLILSAIDGNPALSFNGASDFYNLAGQVLTGQQFTIIAVASDTGNTNSPPSQREIFSNWNGAGGNATTSVFFGTTTGTPGTRSARLSDDFGSTYGVGTISSPATPFVFTGVSGASDATLYQDGTLIADKGTPLSTRNLTGNYVIGQQGTLNSEWWSGDIAEVLVYNRDLTVAERQSVESYLLAKYTSSPPGTVVTSSATVSDPAVVATGGFTVNAVAGSDSGLQTVATFTDPGGAEPVSHYGALVNWGDGSPTDQGTITLNGGTFTVQDHHTYAMKGNIPITVQITHESAPTAGVASSAVVTAATAVSISAPSITYNANGVVTVTVSSSGGTPTGNVSLTVDNGTPVTHPLSAQDTATFTLSSPGAGDHSLTASYAAQGLFLASAATGVLHVNPAATTTSLSAPTVTYNADGLVTVTVAAPSGVPAPTGVLSLTVDSSVLSYGLTGADNGSHTFDVGARNAGSHALSASYAAQGNYAGSSASGTLTVNRAATSVGISAPDVTYNSDGSVTLTVSSASGTPTGMVSLSVDGGAAVSQGLTNGSATFTVGSPSADNHTLSASYAAQGNFAASSATGSLQVNAAATSVGISAPPITYNSDATVTVTVSTAAGVPTATGSVTLTMDGGNAQTLSLASGQATFTLASPSAGEHGLSATYNPTSNFQSSSSTGNLQVMAAATTTSLSAPTLVYNEAGTVTVTVAAGPGVPTPTGNATLTLDNGTPQTAALDANGQASFQITGPDVTTNPHTLTASYAAQGNYAGSSSSLTLNANQSATSVALNAAAVTYNADGVVLVTVTSPDGTPSGSVSLTVDSTIYTATLNGSGQATFTLSSPSAGDHTLTASYAPQGDFGGSTAGGTLHVDQAPTSTGLDAPTITYNANGVVTVAVSSSSGTPSGMVSLGVDGGPAVTQPLDSHGTSVFTLASPAAGDHLLHAVYAAQGNFSGSSADALLHVIRAATAVGIDAPTVTYNANGTVTVTVSSGSGNPTGNVSLTIDGGAALTQALDGSGQSVFTIPSPAAGAHSLHVDYATQGNFSQSSANASLTVNQAPTEVSVSAPDVTYNADGIVSVTVSPQQAGVPAPAGDVTLTVDSNSFTAAVDASGHASFTLATPSSGDHDLMVSYASQGNYAGSSATGTLHVIAAPTSLALSAPDVTFNADGIITVMVMPQQSGVPTPAGSVTLVVNGDSANPLTAVLDATGHAQFTLTSPDAGAYTLSASYAAQGNFAGSSSGGLLQVNKANAFITINPYSGVYDGAAHVLSGSATGVRNEDLSSLLHVGTAETHAGHYVVAWAFDGNTDYNPAGGNSTIDIAQAAISYQIGNDSQSYGSAADLATDLPGMLSTGVNGETLTIAYSSSGDTNTAHVRTGGYDITGTLGNGSGLTADYTVTLQSGTLTVNPVALTITADTLSKDYGAPLPALTASYTGFVNDDTSASLTAVPTLTTTATPQSHVGTYTISASAAIDADYTIGYVAGSLTIDPVALSITADSQTMVYGGTQSTLTASYAGFVNGDTPASLTTLPTLSTVPASSHAGTYAITASGAVDPDYAISYAAGTSSITPAVLTITADSQSMVYGGAMPALTASYSGLVNGDTPATFVAVGNTAPSVATVPASSSAGSYPITVSGASDSDYAITLVEGTLTINKANASITITPYNIAYDSNAHTATGTVMGVGSDGALAGLDLSGTMHTSAGVYTDTWTFTDTTGNYNDASGTVSDSIAKAHLAITILASGTNPGSGATEEITVAPYSATYDGSSQSAVGSVTGVVGENLLDEGDILDLSGTVHTNAGTYNGDAWSFTDVTGNYYDASGTVNDFIDKAASSTTTMGDGPFTYDGTIHSGGSGAVTGAGGLSTSATSMTYSGDQLDAGTYYVTAHFAGDANHYGSDGAAVAIPIRKAASSTTTVGDGPFLYDATIHSGGSGMVTGAGSLSTSATSLTYTGDQVNAGTYYVTAHYAGDANHSGSDGSAVAITINKAGTATTVASSESMAGFGDLVTFTATVTNTSTSPTPRGSVLFVVDGTTYGPQTLGGGQAGVSFSNLSAGSHTVTASYTSSDGNFQNSSGSLAGGQSVCLLTGSVYVLNPSVSGATTLSGNATLNLPGVLVVDSSSSSAVLASGNAQVTAAGVLVTGNVSRTGKASVAKTGSPAATNDPLASLMPPLTTGLTSYGAVTVAGISSKTLSPGIYSSIQVSGNAAVTLCAGTYILKGGGLTVTGNASLSGSNVFFFNAGSGYSNDGTTVIDGGSFGGITLSGNGSFNLSAPTSGPCSSVLIYQARDNTRALNIGGNATVSVSGTIYAANALLTMSGNGQLHDTLVVGTLNVGGNVNLTQLAMGSDGSGDILGIANTLLAGNLDVYTNDPAGFFSTDMLARIQDTIDGWDAVLAPYNVVVTQVSDPSLANLTIDDGATSAVGDMADGVLGCWNPSQREITILQGWNWYAGAHAAGIGAGQYDFQTTMSHEIGHALGLGGSTSTTSPMNEILPTGTARRVMTAADLNIPEPPDDVDPLTAAGAFSSPVPAAVPAVQADITRRPGPVGPGGVGDLARSFAVSSGDGGLILFAGLGLPVNTSVRAPGGYFRDSVTQPGADLLFQLLASSPAGAAGRDASIHLFPSPWQRSPFSDGPSTDDASNDLEWFDLEDVTAFHHPGEHQYGANQTVPMPMPATMDSVNVEQTALGQWFSQAADNCDTGGEE